VAEALAAALSAQTSGAWMRKAARALAHAREQDAEAELDELAAARLQGYGAGLEDLRAPRWVAVGGGAGRRGSVQCALMGANRHCGPRPSQGSELAPARAKAAPVRWSLTV